jgi:hypothetical protein
MLLSGRPPTPWSRFRDPRWVRAHGAFLLLFFAGAAVLARTRSLALGLPLLAASAIPILVAVIADQRASGSDRHNPHQPG